MAPAVAATDERAAHQARNPGKMRQFMTGLRKYVQENAEYVGPKFAEEARKIHYGEIDRTATSMARPRQEEAQELVEEGVTVGARCRPISKARKLRGRCSDRAPPPCNSRPHRRQPPIPGQRIEGNTLCFQDG